MKRNQIQFLSPVRPWTDLPFAGAGYMAGFGWLAGHLYQYRNIGGQTVMACVYAEGIEIK